MKSLVTPDRNIEQIQFLLLFFSKKGFNVKSFGTGDKVKLPGNAPDRPNIYDFGTSYDEIYNDLLSKDKQ